MVWCLEFTYTSPQAPQTKIDHCTNNQWSEANQKWLEATINFTSIGENKWRKYLNKNLISKLWEANNFSQFQ